MRRLLGALIGVTLACGACTSGSADDEAKPSPATPEAPAVSLASLGIDWPAADGGLEPADPPPAPAGFDDGRFARMAGILTDWAQLTTLDEDVRYSAQPVEQIAEAFSDADAADLREEAAAAVSPGLMVANVFGDEVTVVGAPRVTTAWDVSTETDDAGEQYTRLALQTRAAYEVRLGDDAPTRVIGVLRVHALNAYRDTTDDFGLSWAWQEFGALDCALALDDDLVPEDDLDAAERDLKTFIEVGAGEKLVMPPLPREEQVDKDYLERCRNGMT